MTSDLTQAVELVFGDPQVLGIIVAAAFYGVFMGAMPGLTATMAVALIVPVTFFMGPVPTLAAVVTMEACAIFAGDIPNALLRIPGTPSSAAYADDAYRFTRVGQQDRALGMCLVFSVAGGLFGAIVLILFAHQMARFATSFTVVEYFWLYLLGLTCAVVVTKGSPLKGAFSLLIGLLLSTVGLSAVHTEARFTFGQPELFQGINFIPAMIGLFGVSGVLRNVFRLDQRVVMPPAETAAVPPGAGRIGQFARRSLRSVFGEALPSLWQRRLPALRSGMIGSAVGMLPGAGADIAAWVSLGAGRRRTAAETTPAETDRHALDRLADATTANSSALAGAWVPALVFGIPGDSVTALVIGILLMKDVQPGPEIFEKQAALVYSIYLMFILANLVLIGVGFLAIKAGGTIVRMPRRVLLPLILLFCVIGSYAYNSSYFDVWVMLAMGLLGFALERRQVPLGPLVLGIILGGPLEERFIQAMTGAEASPLTFLTRPIAAVLALMCLVLWAAPVVMAIRRRFQPE